MNIPTLLNAIKEHYDSLEDKTDFTEAIAKTSPVQRIAHYGLVLQDKGLNILLTQEIRNFCVSKGLFNYA